MQKIVRGLSLVNTSVQRRVREEWLGQRFPLNPTYLQLRVNDVCDAHCTMCNIWQHKPGQEISPAALRDVLIDSLFDSVTQVEITGGEPTLRTDLPAIGDVLVAALPQLEKVKITTNGLQPSVVIEHISVLAQTLRQATVPLTVCVSLDGIGSAHDQNRGTDGGFAAAVQVIEAFQKNNTSVSVRCTLTPLTSDWADDVLLWCDQHGISDVSFQVGMDVARFDNQGYVQQHAFSQEQCFHLAMFFDMLLNRRKHDLASRMYFKSIIDQLAFNAPRKATCIWQTRAIALDTRGDLSFCPVHSKIMGSAVEQNAKQVYRTNIPERKRILREHCASCLYNSYGPPTLDQITQRAGLVLRGTNPIRRQNAQHSVTLRQTVNPADRDTPKDWQHVLITGWYGTETTGDKAILGEVLHFIKTQSPNCKVTITTIDRKVSDQTERELAHLRDSSLVAIKHGHDPALIEQMDAVIMGGGPLMETQAMESVWRMFAEANRQHKARIIFGCGVGPFHTDHIRDVTVDVIGMATAGFLRDHESHELATKLVPGNVLEYACDPALAHLKRWKTNHLAASTEGTSSLQIATLLRANTNEFVAGVQSGDLEDANTKAARQLAHVLETVSRVYPVQVHMLPMNSHWLGGDDRLFNRQVAGFFETEERVHVMRGYLTLDGVLQRLSTANAGVAMRYHGHLFCIALGIPFLSIDYTGRNGKVSSLMRRIGYEQWSEVWQTLDQDRASKHLQQIFDERDHWSTYLQQQAEKLVSELENTYARVFLHA